MSRRDSSGPFNQIVNTTLESERTPEELRSVLVVMKGDVQRGKVDMGERLTLG